MKKSKKTVVITVSIVGVIVLLFVCGLLTAELYKDKLESKIFPLKDPVSVINSEYKRSVVCVDWAFDISDKRKVAGFSDYVFVAQVKKVIGTGYTGVKIYNGFDLDAQPFTQYEIRVLENIKGKLITYKDIPMKKHDGVEAFGKSGAFFGNRVSLLEGDRLPDAGECYIFLCSADEDGELNIGSFGAVHNIYLCKAEDYTGNEALIEAYREAVKNMDESVRFGEDFKSKYDAE